MNIYIYQEITKLVSLRMHGMKHNVDTINFRSCFDYLFSQKNIYLYIYEPRALSYRLTKELTLSSRLHLYHLYLPHLLLGLEILRDLKLVPHLDPMVCQKM